MAPMTATGDSGWAGRRLGRGAGRWGLMQVDTGRASGFLTGLALRRKRGGGLAHFAVLRDNATAQSQNDNSVRTP